MNIVLDKYIDIDGQTLHYEQTGTTGAPPMILMHGWGCDLTTVRSIANAASSSHEVFNVDLPGFGKSPEPESAQSVYQYASLMEKFAASLGLKKPVVAGHSFGGRLAIIMASGNMDLDSVILVDAAGIKPRRSFKYYLKVYTFKLVRFVMETFLPHDMAQRKVDALRRSRGSSDYATSSPRMREIMSKAVNEDLSPLLSNIHTPTLLIWGENDSATPISDARKMEKLIPDAGLVSFPACGHYSFLDNPGQFAAVLHSFLSSRIASNQA